MQNENSVMRCGSCGLIALLALALSISGAAALDAGKIAAINKAADSFVALAKDSAKTGQPPRQSDPGVKPLLDTVFDTTEIHGGPAQPMTALENLNAWNFAVLKVGLVYILAGTGIADITKLPNTPEMAQKINHNTVEFSPEMGRYFDAQLWIEAAVMDTVGAFIASASKAQLEQPNFKGGLEKIRAGATQTIYGALTTLPVEGLSDSWAARPPAGFCGHCADRRALPAARPGPYAELRRNRNSRRSDRPSGQSGADVVRFNGGTALIFDLYFDCPDMDPVPPSAFADAGRPRSSSLDRP